MGLFDKAERGIERAVSSAFARAFKAEVQPVEIASAIRETMDDRAAVMGPGRVIVPNRYAVQLAEADFDRLKDYGETLVEELVAAAEEHRESQRYAVPGPIRVIIQQNETLDAGMIDVEASSSRPKNRPAREPMHEAGPDSLRSRATGPRFNPGPDVDVPPEPPVHGHTTAPYDARPPRSRPEARPYLDLLGERYPLLGAITVLGRDDSADIILDDTGISRRHAEIRITHDGPRVVTTIRDLGSTNGTYVNDERIDSVHLRSGDTITLGRVTVTFQRGEPR